MNPLKERKTAAITKTITTLFICASLLIGLMVMSLSFTQTAMAQQGPPEDTPQGPPEDTPQGPPEDDTTTTEDDTTTTEDDTTTTEDDTTTITANPQRRGPPATPPQCSDDAIRFEQGRCIEPSEIDCGDLGEEFIVNPNNPEECIAPAEPELVCDPDAGQLNEQTKLCEEAPVCPPGPSGTTYTYINARDRCERTPTATNPCSLGSQGTETRENIGMGQQRCVPKNNDVCDQGEDNVSELDEDRDLCTTEPDEVCPDEPNIRPVVGGGCEFFEPSNEFCPGGGEPTAGECRVRPGNRG